VYEDQSSFHGLGSGVRDRKSFTADVQFGAPVRGLVAGQALDEGRLSASILTDKCVNLAGLEHEIEVSEGPLSREGLRE
jgi:hypothetical protein